MTAVCAITDQYNNVVDIGLSLVAAIEDATVISVPIAGVNSNS